MTSVQRLPHDLRILVADDHPIVLAGIKSLIDAAKGMTIVGEASDGREAITQSLNLEPDVLILDITLPGLSGAKVAERLLAENPAIKIIIMTVHEDKAYLRQFLELGVSGYILKTSAADQLVQAIHAASNGGIYLDPRLVGQVRGKNMFDAESLHQAVELSSRELEVLKLSAAGNSNKFIAGELRLGIKSVETYKARGMEKLGFNSRVQLIRYALAKGWLEAI